MRNRPNRVVVAAAAGLVLVGAACTRTETREELRAGAPTSTTPATPRAEDGPATTRAAGSAVMADVEFVSLAAERSCTVDSASFTMAFRFDTPSGPAGAGAEGAFDTVAGRSRFALSYGDLVQRGLGDAGETELFEGLVEAVGDGIEVVTDGDTVYLRAGLLGTFLGVDTPWAAVSGPDAAVQRRSLAPLGSSDPCDLLEVLRGVGEVSEAGREPLDGVTTTHYRVVVDPARAVERAPAEARDDLEAAVTALEGLEPEVDVWIGEDGVVRRVVYTFGEGSASPMGSGTLTFDLFGVGAPVEIAVPPADQVTELDAAALGGGLFGPD